MRAFFNAIRGLPHGEERPGAAGARLEPRTAPMQRNSCPASMLNLSYPLQNLSMATAKPPRRRAEATLSPAGRARSAAPPSCFGTGFSVFLL
jgi:hypothetical protein